MTGICPNGCGQDVWTCGNTCEEGRRIVEAHERWRREFNRKQKERKADDK